MNTLTDPREQAVQPTEPPAPRHLLAKPMSPDCVCHKCREGIYYVEGVSGPERWKHFRTDSYRCAPICSQCGLPATVRIGAPTMSGDGSVNFKTLRHLCRACDTGFHIDHT